MNETNRPFSAGRAPTKVGIVSIVADGGIYPTFITNREVAFPDYPAVAKGYIADGYGIDLSIATATTTYFNGSVDVYPDGENTRVVSPSPDEYVYKTPKFKIEVYQGDVVNKPWHGVVITISCLRTTNVYSVTSGYPPVLVSTTTVPVSFTYTFSAADDPTVGSPYYVSPNATVKGGLLGDEYLYSSIVYTSLIPPATYLLTETSQTDWLISSTTPP